MEFASYINDMARRHGKYKFHISPTQENTHNIVVLSPDAFNEILKVQDFRQSIPASLKKRWEELKGRMELTASYSSSVDDTITLSLLAGQMGVSTRVYYKKYGRSWHIILKGNQRLRSILTATRYKARHTKVLSIGLGLAGAKHIAKTGGFITIWLLSAFRVLDFVLSDQATLGKLIGSLATDVVKVAIAVGASLFAAGFFATFAIGPLLAVIAIGVGASWGLSKFDERYKLTETLNKNIDEFLRKTKNLNTDFVLSP